MLYQRPATFKRIIVMKMTSMQITRWIYFLLFSFWSDLSLRNLCDGRSKGKGKSQTTTRRWSTIGRSSAKAPAKSKTSHQTRSTPAYTHVTTMIEHSKTALRKTSSEPTQGSTTAPTGYTYDDSTWTQRPTRDHKHKATTSPHTVTWSHQPEREIWYLTSTGSEMHTEPVGKKLQQANTAAAAAGSVTSLLVICGLAGLVALVIFRKRKAKREARRGLSKEGSKQDLSIDNPTYNTKLPENHGWSHGFGDSPESSVKEPDILAESGIGVKPDVYAVPKKRGKLENSNGGYFGTGYNSADGPYTTVFPETSEEGIYCKADIDSAIEADYIELVEGPGETNDYDVLTEGMDVRRGVNQEFGYKQLVNVHGRMSNSELTNDDDDLCVMQENDMYEKADWDVSRGMPRNQPRFQTNEEPVFPEEETDWASDDVTTIVENVIYNK